ncbi:MAG: hypothetical protein F4201_08725 [Nitrospira sp. SB0677_bin_15]|nr:hypothetical protein [Nitrospira sp. SB0677_bin_15]
MPAVSTSGIVTLLDSGADRLAVTVTELPSATEVGSTDRLTDGGGSSSSSITGGGSSSSSTTGGGGSSSSSILTSTEDGLPAVTDAGSVPSATVNVSSS